MWKKGVSAVLASALLLSAVTACHKRDDNGNGRPGESEGASPTLPVSGEEIENDSAWYNVQTLTCADLYNGNEYEYAFMDILGIKDGNVAVMFQGERKAAGAGSNSDTGDAPVPARDSMGEYVEKVDIFTLSGDLVNSIDLGALVDEAGVESDTAFIDSATFEGDNLKFILREYDPDTWDVTTFEITADIGSGAFIDCHEVTSSDEEDFSFEGSYAFDGYTVSKNYYWGEDTGYYILAVTTPDGNEYGMDLRQEISGTDVFDIPNIIYLGDGKAIAPYTSGGCATGSFGTGYILFDFAGRSAEICEEDMSWIGKADLNSCVYTDEGVMAVGREGLICLDFNTKTAQLLVDFNCANVNRFDSASYEFLGVDNGRYLFRGSYYTADENDVFSYSPTLVTFEAADSNPNAGKTYIRVAAPGGVTYEEAEAVRRFNEVSGDGFIVFDYSYDPAYVEDACYGDTFTTRTDEELDAEAQMSNALSIDLMTGDGPDMVFGTIGYSQLDSDDYLLDLSDMIPEGNYFDNVFEAARVDGKLYQIPLDCGFAGITASGDDIGYDQMGFTFDTYDDFVDDVCNGNDPIGLGRMDFLSLCYSAMNDSFTNGNGGVDYDNEAFRALAEFTRDLPDDSSMMECAICEREDSLIGYTNVYCLDDYLYTFGSTSESTRLMGVPTYDGRGPLIKVSDSVGISSTSASADICREFVEYLLSFDGQMIFSDGGKTPVSVDAFEAGAADDIERYNERVQEYLTYLTRDELAACGFFAEEVDEGVIDAYEGFIRAASTIEMSDPAVTKIIREEIAAYYEGQKTLDEVVEILQDRVQTFVNERG